MHNVCAGWLVKTECSQVWHSERFDEVSTARVLTLVTAQTLLVHTVSYSVRIQIGE